MSDSVSAQTSVNQLSANSDRKERLARDLIRQLNENTLPHRSSLPENWALLGRIRREDATPGDFRTTQQYVIDSVLEDIEESDYPDDEDLLDSIKERLSDVMDMTLSSPQVTPTNSSSSGSRNFSSEEFHQQDSNGEDESESSDSDSLSDSEPEESIGS